MSLEIQLDKEVSITIPSYIIPIFSNIKNNEPVLLKDSTESSMKIIYDFAEIYVKMDEKEKKIYSSPDTWDESSTEYIWYKSVFAEMKMLDVLNLTNTSDKLGFGALSTICSWHIANIIRDKNQEQLRDIFGIKDSFPGDEWCF